MNKEKIICAAMKLNTGTIISVPAPWGHGDIIQTLSQYRTTIGEKMPRPFCSNIDDIEGFLTNAGRFVDRVEGLKIAVEQEQIIKKHGASDQLYSEDIWYDDRSQLYERMLYLKKEFDIEFSGSYYLFWETYGHLEQHI